MAILDLTRGAAPVAARHDEDLAERGIRIARAVLIGRPAPRVYDFWRDFANLPGVMRHLERVEALGGNRAGEVRFADAPGERGTEVRVELAYLPPAGLLGQWVATLSGTGTGAERQVREGLRDLKRLMEVGELPTIDGQPRGPCRGHGRREEYRKQLEVSCEPSSGARPAR